MHILKRYLFFHISAFLGYYFFWGTMYAHRKSLLSLDFENLFSTSPHSAGSAIIFTSIFLFIFWGLALISLISLELLIHYLTKKIFQKDISINIKNKYYNMFFNIGIIFLILFFTPAIYFFTYSAIMLILGIFIL